jgi:transcription initiation factor TFIIIB Brf1 subunit/transcription initiation factor TFIIB
MLLKGVYIMRETCPKCNKEIVEEDIEAEKAYCRSCMEWIVLKEGIINEEYTIFGKLTLKESRYVAFSIILSKFATILVIFFTIIYGLAVLFAIMVLIVNIIFNNNFNLFQYMYIFYPLLIAFPMVFLGFTGGFTGSYDLYPKYILTKNGLKRFYGNSKLFKEYDKHDIKRIILKNRFIVIHIYINFFYQNYIPIVDSFFENKMKYNQFVEFINTNYKEKIELK